MKRQYGFVSATAKNNYEVDIVTCNTLKEAQERLKKTVEDMGEQYLNDNIFVWIDDNDKLMFYGAFDLNTSLYGDWLLLIDEYLYYMYVKLLMDVDSAGISLKFYSVQDDDIEPIKNT